MVAKQIKIEEIIKIKQQRKVLVNGKKIENLDAADIEEVSLETFDEYLTETQKKVAADNENRIKKTFVKVDYIERERRAFIAEEVAKAIPDPKIEQEEYNSIKKAAELDFSERKDIQKRLAGVADQLVHFMLIPRNLELKRTSVICRINTKLI